MRKAHIVDQERQGDRSRSEWGERGGSNTTKCCRFGDRGVNEDRVLRWFDQENDNLARKKVTKNDKGSKSQYFRFLLHFY